MSFIATPPTSGPEWIEAVGLAIVLTGLVIGVVGLLARRAERRFRIMCFACVAPLAFVGALFVRTGFVLEGAGEAPLQARQWLQIIASMSYIPGVIAAAVGVARKKRPLVGNHRAATGLAALCVFVGVVLDVVGLVIAR